MSDERKSPTRVSGRDSLVKLRDDDVISPGGSQVLHLSLSVLQRRPRKSTGAEESLTYITSIIQDMRWALTELNEGERPNCTAMELEIWGCFLDRQLSQSSRNYHSVAHIFEISAGAGPLQVLAAFFRDCVHYAIDDGDPATQMLGQVASNSRHLTVQGILQGYLIPGTHTIAPDLSEGDRLVCFIFGYRPEQDLSSSVRGWHKGLDILLSAVVVTRILQKCLSRAQIAQLCVCLEATIPNRLRDNNKPLEDVYQRLIQANKEFNLDLSEDDMIETVQQACDLWNRQVGNLMSDDLSVVLDHTWRLLPEVNPALRRRALYKLNEYHIALQSMTNVIGSMRASTIVMEFREIPCLPEAMQFKHLVSDNMDLVSLYLKVRLLAVAIVAALACLTGGDAPKSFFFGDEPLAYETDYYMDQLGDKLLEDEDRIDTAAEYRKQVYEALCGERRTSGFDTQRAPLAAYLYRTLGDDRIAQILQDCHILDGPLPLTNEGSWGLLRAMPRTVVCTVAEEMSRFTISRQAALDRVMSAL